ncbi:MAG: hypothetical protein NTV46_19310 [Verrucomicrobia bacterium]|nr:hypothetical protein [Verrucomicrobiota bacterium]
MAKPKKKLTAAQRAEKKRRKKEFMTIFINGKQKRVRREPTIDGMDVEEFIRQNADDIWLHQHGYYEILHERAMEEAEETSNLTPSPPTRQSSVIDDSGDIPF